MFETELLRFIEDGRLAADGMPFGVLRAATKQLRDGEAWRDVWETASLQLESAAEAAVKRGCRLSAAEWLWLASLAAHISQLHHYTDPAWRASAEDRRRRLYDRSVSSLPLPARRVTIQCGAAETTGYVRLPSSRKSTPCVILLGGLDSTKEESLMFENLCLARGMATFVFDGPGQGELRNRVGLGEDFRPWIGEVLRLLHSIHDIDPDRIGILGRSLGGHYALRAAADVPGLRCCVAWSPLGTCQNWDGYPEPIKWGFCYAANTTDMEKARRIVETTLTLDDAFPRIKIPTYVVHGENDAIVSSAERDAMRRMSAPGIRHETILGGNHCCHNFAYLVRPTMADWAAEILAAS